MTPAIGLSSPIRYHASFYSDEAQQNIECTKRMRINIGVERVRSWDSLRDKGADNTRYVESYRYVYRQHTHVGRRTGQHVDSELFLKKRIWRWTSRLVGVIDASPEMCAIKSVKNASKCRGLSLAGIGVRPPKGARPPFPDRRVPYKISIMQVV